MIGAIADDVTGGTDVAVAFRRRGLRTVLFFGLPAADAPLDGADAAVVCLKSRTIPVTDAVAQSLAAGDWLQAHGAQQIFFKYCSTFDSTDQGNIGPVSDALAEHLGAGVVPMTPASPAHLRTQYNGYLFVGEQLLSESHMRHHPLTPMTDAYLPRVMEAQSRHRVASVPLDVVRSGSDAIGRRLSELGDLGYRYALLDALVEDDLILAGAAVKDSVLVTGAAGLAEGLAAAHAADRQARSIGPRLPDAGTRSAVLAGSCSARTLEQVDAMHAAGRPAFFLDPLEDADPDSLAAAALDWYDRQDGSAGSPLVYSSVAPDRLRRIQDLLGTQRTSDVLEDAIGQVAVGLADRGVRRFVCAGGETSGAIVGALGVSGGVIGAEAATGVPWIFPPDSDGLELLLKSGNFGDPELLVRASSQRPDLVPGGRHDN